MSRSELLTREVKNVAHKNGAVLVGVASIERFEPRPPFHDQAPEGHGPLDFLPDAKSVLSIAQPILNPVMDIPASLADREMEMIPHDVRRPFMESFYNRTGHVIHDFMLEFIAQVTGQFLMREGYEAMIFPTTGVHPSLQGLSDREIWEGPSERWAEKYSPFRYTYGPFSHRHAATRAGLGEFGYNNLVLTPQFGPRQRFNTIITNAPLVEDPLLQEPLCLRDECNLCQNVCTMDAIMMRDDPRHGDYRSVDAVETNVIFIDPPAKTDPTLCRQRRNRVPDPPIRADCLRVCPVPRVSPYLPDRLREFMRGRLDDRLLETLEGE